MSQSSYAISPSSPGYPGQLVDLSPHDILSRVNVEGAGIPYGVAVARAAEGTVDLVDASNDVVVGVVVRADHYNNAALSSDLGVPDKAMCSVLRQGKIWVKVQDACVEGGQVFVRHGGSGQLGGFLGSDDGSNASLLAGARWGSTQASADGMAILILDGLTGAMS